MAIINVAFRNAYRELDPVERDAILVYVQNALDDGLADPKDVAICALKRAGYSPRYIMHGEIGSISI